MKRKKSNIFLDALGVYGRVRAFRSKSNSYPNGSGEYITISCGKPWEGCQVALTRTQAKLLRSNIKILLDNMEV